MTIYTNRIEWIDNAKALGILLVVLGHFQMSNGHISGFIYTFHMPLFFLISGILIGNTPLTLSFPQFLRQKVTSLVVPYYLFQLLCGIYMFMRITFTGGDVNLIFKYIIGSLMGNPSQMFCIPGWFLWALFWCNILVYVQIHSNKHQLIIFYSVLCLSLLFSLPKVFSLYTVPYSFIFYFVGYKFKQYIRTIGDVLNSRPGICLLSSAICFASVYIIYGLIGNLDIGRNHYTNYPLISLFTAFIGIFGVISLCCISRKQRKIITVISSSTLLIMCLHIPLIQFIQLHIFKPPTNIHLSLGASILIVALLAALYVPVKDKLPWLIGKGNLQSNQHLK